MDDILRRAITAIAYTEVNEGGDPKDVADRIAEEVIVVLTDPQLRQPILEAMKLHE